MTEQPEQADVIFHLSISHVDLALDNFLQKLAPGCDIPNLSLTFLGPLSPLLRQ